MNTTEISKMEKFEKSYWWHVGKKNLIKHLIEQNKAEKELTILEIGCGAGEITEMLTKYGQVYGNDVSDDAIEACEKRGLKNLFKGDINQLDLTKYHEKFDVILALDVLEHIQNDIEALKRINSMLKPNGLLIASVPAYKFLWSSHDEALEHKRRYTTFELTQKIKDNGFRLLKNSHFVFFAFPPIAIFKFLSNFITRTAYPKSSYIELPEKLNTFMVKVLDFEIQLMDNFKLPFGTTIVVTARKN